MENIDFEDPRVIGSLIPLGIICLVVIFGNMMVIAAVRMTSKLRGATNLFIVSLAWADLMLGVVVLPSSATYEVGKWVFCALLFSQKDIILALLRDDFFAIFWIDLRVAKTLSSRQKNDENGNGLQFSGIREIMQENMTQYVSPPVRELSDRARNATGRFRCLLGLFCCC